MALSSLQAPARWHRVDVLSDIHLQPSAPETFAAWRRAVQDTAADAVFLLGDVFEAWIGDDAAEAESFEAECMDVLRAAAARRPVYFQHGNRDFLMGEAFLQAHGVALLQDPCRLRFGDRTWLLSHGDALCIDDLPYMAFRTQARAPEWQAAFLGRPLAARRELAREMRRQSESQQRADPGHGDVDPAAARQALQAADASILVHGHTHRPGEHILEGGLQRIVLSDWDLRAQPPRAEVLELSRDGGWRRRSLA